MTKILEHDLRDFFSSARRYHPGVIRRMVHIEADNLSHEYQYRALHLVLCVGTVRDSSGGTQSVFLRGIFHGSGARCRTVGSFYPSATTSLW